MRPGNIFIENDFVFQRDTSISLLLGAGFSSYMGYPLSIDINRGLLHLDESHIAFEQSGQMALLTDENEQQSSIGYNEYETSYYFCRRLIKEYDTQKGEFDYEKFFDFILSQEIKESYFRNLAVKLINENETYEDLLNKVRCIYNKLVAHMIKDRNGKCDYDGEPYIVGTMDGYDNFLKSIAQWAETKIVNVHTLNHDLLFESFNNTEWIHGNISDGFDEFGSPYYGELLQNGRYYRCRLERYTGKYCKPIRLYKLHGSINYVPFYKKVTNSDVMVPEKYIKTRWGIGVDNLQKSEGSKRNYKYSPFAYHADFLTGTTTKIRRYQEPLLFKKLFRKFRNNLRNAEKLIIIGYGCKDVGINEIIKENFDYNNKPSFIIDPNPGKGTEEFADNINAKIIKKGIEDFTID